MKKRCRHKWEVGVRYGGSHPGYCAVNGAHMKTRCRKCGAERVNCPAKKGYYYNFPDGTGNWGR